MSQVTKMMNSSIFRSLQAAPVDPILGITLAFKGDNNPKKVDLGVGAYRTEEGRPFIFETVKRAENELLNDSSIDKEYLPIDGLQSLKSATQKILFSSESLPFQEQRICSAQSLSGTGGLYLVAQFLRKCINFGESVYVSKPTWANHRSIFELTGLKVQEYPYWNQVTRSLDLAGMLDTLEKANPGSLVLLHGCAHNPTGVDPTENDWYAILDVVKRRNLIPLLDIAYQGFATGSLKNDAFSCQLFANSGLEMFAVQSFAKSMGLYGERIGMLHMICSTKEQASIALGNLKQIIRSTYSNPPVHGALILSKILNNPSMFSSWTEELEKVVNRISSVRKSLHAGLIRKKTPGNWDHLEKQIGMFSYTGLSPDQCERMVKVWHVYLLKNGRISLAGLNNSNIDYVIDAIDDCVRTLPQSDSRF